MTITVFNKIKHGGRIYFTYLNYNAPQPKKLHSNDIANMSYQGGQREISRYPIYIYIYIWGLIMYFRWGQPTQRVAVGAINGNC